MTTSIKDYNYELPKNLIADKPRSKREQAKLMIFDNNREHIEHTSFSYLAEHINEGDLLILNDTKVIPGRLFLKKESGGNVEILFHKHINEREISCIHRSSRKVASNSKLFIDDNNFFVVDKVDGKFITLSSQSDPMIYFTKYGSVPLPKYIKRETTNEDVDRYQTVYAREDGSVAAPTAGLHFTNKILSDLKNKGVIVDYLTLHVTYNTFKPITSDDYNNHEIGSEDCSLRESLLQKIQSAKRKNKKVYAVGTTATRALENYASKSYRGDFVGEADLFIKPGYQFKIIDGLITNFHLPKSTLLLLVSSLVGREKILNLYDIAIKNNYRFYSYGDSMFIKI